MNRKRHLLTSFNVSFCTQVNLLVVLVAAVSSLLAVVSVGAVLLLVNRSRRARTGKLRDLEQSKHLQQQQQQPAQDEYKVGFLDMYSSVKKLRCPRARAEVGTYPKRRGLDWDRG